MSAADESPRLEDLCRWATEVSGETIQDLLPLAGDVSPRRYFRARTSRSSVILAYYPCALRESCERFLRSTQILSAIGVRVPKILATDGERGLMLLEDVGGKTLFDRRDEGWATLLPLVRSAVSVAVRIARDVRREDVAGLNPPLGAELMLRELGQTWDLFLDPNRLCGDAALRRRLRSALELLCCSIEQEGLVPCHRDFMVRNLVDDHRADIVVLDHQDLRLGPRGYDIASLLNDSLFPPHDLARRLIESAGIDPASYHRSAAQRTLKVIGTFVSFARQGQPRYLRLVPRSLRRCLYHLASLPETAPLASDLSPLWRPVC